MAVEKTFNVLFKHCTVLMTYLFHFHNEVLCIGTFLSSRKLPHPVKIKGPNVLKLASENAFSWFSFNL